jgi:hypothetical protein
VRRIRPIKYEDRLSVVDHLDELRTRLIICAVAFVVAWAFTAWQNDLVLEIVNKPLPDELEEEGPITLGPAADVRAAVAELARQVAADVTEERREVARVVVKVRFAPFFTFTHGQKMQRPTTDAHAIEQAALAALGKFTDRRPVRLVGVRAEFGV